MIAYDLTLYGRTIARFISVEDAYMAKSAYLRRHKRRKSEQFTSIDNSLEVVKVRVQHVFLTENERVIND